MSVAQTQHSAEVAAYTEATLIAADTGLTNAYENSTRHGIPMIAVSPAQGQFLSLLTRMAGAAHVLEIGTLGGYSTIWLARAAGRAGGRVTSIEVDADRRAVAQANLAAAGVTNADVRLGKALDVLPQLADAVAAGAPRYDFVFVDADWEHQWAYFDWAVRLGHAGTVVYVDNVVRELLANGSVGPAPRDTTENLVERVGADARVDAVVIQTVGSKDFDGFLMAIVKDSSKAE